MMPCRLGICPLIYSSVGPWGFGGWPLIEKKSMSFPPAFLAGLDGQRAKGRPYSQRHVPPYILSKPSNIVRPRGLRASPYKKTTSVKYKA
jgi:hypothetical protein